MKKLLMLVVTGVALVGLTGLAAARWGGPMGSGPAMMGQDWTTAGWHQGGGMMGGGHHGPGWGMMGGCPWGGGPTTTTITQDQAKELAEKYAQIYFPGYTVEKVEGLSMPHGTAYLVELKGPKGETARIHIGPFGHVMASAPSTPSRR